MSEPEPLDDEAASGATPLSRPVVMPDLFTGDDGQPFKDWLSTFEMCADLNSWNAEIRRQFLTVRLRGNAQEVFRSLDASVQKDYSRLTAELSEHLDPESQESRFKAELRARRQEEDETVSTFGRSVRRLARLAYPSLPLVTRDQLARDQFLDGVASLDLRRTITLSHPKSLDDAIRAAVEYEIASREPSRPRIPTNTATFSVQPSITSSHGDTLTAALEANTATMQEVLEAVRSLKVQQQAPQRYDNRGRGRRNRPMTRTVVCWKCGQPGHVQADCFANRDRSVYTVPSAIASRASIPTHVGSSHLTPPSHAPGRAAALVDGKVNGVPSELLIDTGSASTIISSNLSSKLGNLVLRQQHQNVISATGDSLCVLGVTDIHIQIGDFAATHPTLVCSNVTHDCIIGMDFLRQHECDIKLSTNTLETATTTMPLLVDDSSPYRVAVCETIVVPLYHEMVVPTELSPGREDGKEIPFGLVEARPQYAKRSHLKVARTLVDPTVGQIPVRIANPTANPLTVYKSTHIGNFYPVWAGTAGDETPVCFTCESDNDVKGPRAPGVNGHKTEEEMLDLFQASHLPEHQRRDLAAVLFQYQDVFSKGPYDIGRTSNVYHRIVTGDEDPLRQAPRRLPVHRQKEVRQHLNDMMSQGIIRPSSSPWASPIVLVAKKDGSTRFCVDYRRLNSVTKKDAYPLPRIDDSLDALAGSEFFRRWISPVATGR